MPRSSIRRLATAGPAYEGPAPSDVPVARVRTRRPEPHWVRRGRLERRLDAAVAHDVVLVAAPAGFGKTTALIQWAATLGPAHPVHWLRLTADDNDPRRLVARLVAAVAAPRAVSEPQPEDAVVGMPSGGDIVVPALSALQRQPHGSVLVLSRVERITSPAALSMLAALLADLPNGIRLVLDTRRRPPLPVERLRAAGRLDEIGSDDLRFDVAETGALAERMGCGPLDERAAQRLVQHTGGWPAALFLTLRALRSANVSPSADAPPHPDVVDFVTAEVLDPLDAGERHLLAQLAAVGDWGADDVGEITGDPTASVRFEALRRAEPVIEQVDLPQPRCRVHPVVAAVARATLERAQPDVVRQLHLRASTVLGARGQFESALWQVLASDDAGAVRDALCRHWSALPADSPVITAALGLLGDRAARHDPELALVAAWHAGARREWTDLDRHLARCEDTDGGPAAAFSSIASGAALCRAVFGVGGLEDIRSAARRGRRERDVRWRTLAEARLAWCEVVAGTPTRALELPDPARTAGAEDVAADDPWAALIRPFAVAVRAIALADVGLLDRAASAAEQAVTLGADAGAPPTVRAWGLRASGGVLAQRGRPEEALTVLEEALRLRRTGCTDRTDWPLIELLLTISPVRWQQGQRAAATAALAEARTLLRSRSDAGALRHRLADAERQVSTWAISAARVGLTRRETEMLRLIHAGRTRRQLAGELHVSVNTVKSHLRSAYRKLDVTSRGEALARARAVGVL